MTSLFTGTLMGAHWLVPVIAYIVCAYVGVRTLQKYLADQPDQIKKLTINFFFCSAITVAFAAYMGHLRFDSGTAIVFGVGILNGIANIAQWKAVKVSQSKTSMLSFADDIIAMMLAMLILRDGKYLNLVSGAGMALCISVGILFWWHDNRKKGSESAPFYRNVAIYSVLWGIATFAQRYFAFSEMPVGQFLFAWYLGSLFVIGSRFVYTRRNGIGERGLRLSGRSLGLIFLFTLGIVACLAVEYWAFMLAPQTVVQPLLLASEAIIPTIVGWLIFREALTFDKEQWVYSTIGMIGIVLLAWGFHG